MKFLIILLTLTASACQTTKKNYYANKSIESCGKISDAVYSNANDVSADTAERTAKEQFESEYRLPIEVRSFLAPYLISVCDSFTANYGVQETKLNEIVERLQNVSSKLKAFDNSISFLKKYGSSGFLATRLEATRTFYKNFGINLNSPDLSRLIERYKSAARNVTISVKSNAMSQAVTSFQAALVAEGFSVVQSDALIQISIDTATHLLPAVDGQTSRFVIMDVDVTVSDQNSIIQKRSLKAKGSGLSEASAAKDAASKIVAEIEISLMKNLFGRGEQ